MMKFDIKDQQYAFWLFNQSVDCLFIFGLGDICVSKENNKTLSFCIQYSFDIKEYQMHFVENNIQNVSHHNELL